MSSNFVPLVWLQTELDYTQLPLLIDRLIDCRIKTAGLKGAFENFGGHIVSLNLSNCLSMKSLKHALIFDSTVQESYPLKAVKAVLPWVLRFFFCVPQLLSLPLLLGALDKHCSNTTISNLAIIDKPLGKEHWISFSSLCLLLLSFVHTH